MKCNDDKKIDKLSKISLCLNVSIMTITSIFYKQLKYNYNNVILFYWQLYEFNSKSLLFFIFQIISGFVPSFSSMLLNINKTLNLVFLTSAIPAIIQLLPFYTTDHRFSSLEKRSTDRGKMERARIHSILSWINMMVRYKKCFFFV